MAQARTRARRRLVGAVVLLGIGIVAFPLVFETQPRPVPVDIAIDIPRKDGVPPLRMPASAPARAEAVAPAAPVPASSPAPITAPVAPAEPTPAPRVEAAPEPEAPASRPAAAPARPATAPAASTPPKPATQEDSARARALLEGKAASAAANGSRFVVQVGAFADAAAARETRQKVEKLGLKTYTQVAETPAGNRIRVRLGPFASREEAERVLGRTKAAGVDGVVLTL